LKHSHFRQRPFLPFLPERVLFIEEKSVNLPCKRAFMEAKRICIYPKDVQRITGKSERYGRTLLAQIKGYYQKQEHQFVSVEEFCQYTGLKAEQVYPLIVG
jgi:hypothetical protein